ncbi:hypothetical protein LMJ53_09890 [Rheinheimera sp. UJ51]|uniref:DUF6689 family protein n=1 Tax=Rheinheimera sp. UJ51 TaxID=2892446 RepID=UPI001E55118F|nr:DUF6689 family protein [Rheinheimera sp. UJ51]MCC5452028.1 hypothetical protein [Rheinheimera sp. UJ51]
MLRTILLGSLMLLSSMSLFASTYPVHISGNTAETTITLPGGYEVDVALTFENVMGLTAQNINISAYVANPLSADISSRLASQLISLQAAYPVVIRIEPLANSGFSFSGPLVIDLHTHNLQYSLNTPLRLYKSHDGAAFEDITVATGAGSIRTRGQVGNLSDFIIVADVRPVAQVINQKALKLEQQLNNFASQIAPELLTALQQSVSIIRSECGAVRYPQALSEIKKLQKLISNANAAQIPNVWRSARDIDNVSGMLTASAETLAYSLRLAI